MHLLCTMPPQIHCLALCMYFPVVFTLSPQTRHSTSPFPGTVPTDINSAFHMRHCAYNHILIVLHLRPAARTTCGSMCHTHDMCIVVLALVQCIIPHRIALFCRLYVSSLVLAEFAMSLACGPPPMLLAIHPF